jgi:hypothetical protein
VSQRLNTFLGASPELRQLSGRAARLLALQRLYEQLAPATLARASHVQQLEEKTLTLAANNGAVAAKLRQLAPELLRQLQNGGCEVTQIQVKVQVAHAAARRVAAPAKLGAAARQRLMELAVELPDSLLKNALQRLAGKAAGGR